MLPNRLRLGFEQFARNRTRRHVVCRAIIIAIGLGGPGAGTAQEPGRAEARTFELNDRRAVQCRVLGVQPDGTIRVNMYVAIGFPGDHFFAAGLGGALDEAVLIRAELIEDMLEEPGDALMRVTPKASRHLKVGDIVWRLDPFDEVPQDLPSVIPLRRWTPGDPEYLNSALMHARGNLKEIALALHEFHGSYGHFPPAVVYGPDGKPWHSWRVLLLPYLRSPELQEVDYDYSQPWDSEGNLRALGQTPSVYRDPTRGSFKGALALHAEAEDDAEGQDTHYVAITGEGTAFPSAGMRMSDPMAHPLGGRTDGVSSIVEMTDGTTNTILVGPVGPGREIPWTKPEDLAYSPSFPPPGQPGGFGTPYRMTDVAGNEVGYANLVFGDGMVRAIPESVDPSQFRKLMTIADGAKVDPASLEVDPVRGHFYHLTLELVRDGGSWSARLHDVPISPR